MTPRRTIGYILIVSLSFLVTCAFPGFASVSFLLPGDQPSNQWIPVPSWLTGTWQARFQTFLQCYDYRTREQTIEEPVSFSLNRSRVIGMQIDENGQIWHFAGTPFVRTSETRDFIEKQNISSLALISSGERNVKVQTVASVNRWSKETGQNLDTFNEVTVTTYTPAGDGVIRLDLAIEDFDLNGHRLRSSQSVCIERRLRHFSVIDRWEGLDLKSRFDEFLRKRRRSIGF